MLLFTLLDVDSFPEEGHKFLSVDTNHETLCAMDHCVKLRHLSCISIHIICIRW
jgi:hypothetical protein